MIRELILEGIKVSPQEGLLQRIEDQTVDVPASSISEMPCVPCATPVGPQIGDVGFDKRGEFFEAIRIDGRSSHIRGQIRVLNADDTSRANGYQSATSPQSAMDGV